MANFNPDKIKIGPCVVSYKGSMLGATQGGIKIEMNMETVDIKCDQSYGQAVKRVVTAVKLSIGMTMLEVDQNFSLLLSGDKISGSVIGSNLLNHGGVLQLTPIDANDQAAYRFPNAILEPDASCSILGSAANTLELRFTAWPDSEGTFLEKITA